MILAPDVEKLDATFFRNFISTLEEIEAAKMDQEDVRSWVD